MAVLIIFPVILHTVINLIMLSIGEQGEMLYLSLDDTEFKKRCLVSTIQTCTNDGVNLTGRANLKRYFAKYCSTPYKCTVSNKKIVLTITKKYDIK